jgi:hypothetical protein
MAAGASGSPIPEICSRSGLLLREFFLWKLWYALRKLRVVMAAYQYLFFVLAGLILFSCGRNESTQLADQADEQQAISLDLEGVADSIGNTLNCLAYSPTTDFFYPHILCEVYADVGYLPLWFNEQGLDPSLDSFLHHFPSTLAGKEPAFNSSHLEQGLDSVKGYTLSERAITPQLAASHRM